MKSQNKNINPYSKKSLIHDTNGNVVISLLITVTVVIVLYALIPVIGYNVDSSVTIPGWINESNHSEGSYSQWNSSVNTNLPTGVSLWQTIGQLTKVVLIIAAIAVALFILVSRLGGLGGTEGI